jgi:hypothetical protein
MYSLNGVNNMEIFTTLDSRLKILCVIPSYLASIGVAHCLVKLMTIEPAHVKVAYDISRVTGGSLMLFFIGHTRHTI